MNEQAVKLCLAVIKTLDESIAKVDGKNGKISLILIGIGTIILTALNLNR